MAFTYTTANTQLYNIVLNYPNILTNNLVIINDMCNVVALPQLYNIVDGVTIVIVNNSNNKKYILNNNNIQEPILSKQSITYIKTSHFPYWFRIIVSSFENSNKTWGTKGNISNGIPLQLGTKDNMSFDLISNNTKIVKVGNSGINLYGKKIFNIGNPLKDMEAANKKYVDEAIADSLNSLQNVMNSIIRTNSSETLNSCIQKSLTTLLRNVDEPTELNHVVNKKYVDELISKAIINSSLLQTVADPTEPECACNKRYVDNEVNKINILMNKLLRNIQNVEYNIDSILTRLSTDKGLFELWPNNIKTNSLPNGINIFSIVPDLCTSTREYDAFNLTNLCWTVTNFISPVSLVIQFKYPIRIYSTSKILLTGISNGNNFTVWNISYSLTDSNYTEIADGSESNVLSEEPILVSIYPKFRTIPLICKYIKFTGISIEETNNTNNIITGLKYWQIYNSEQIKI